MLKKIFIFFFKTCSVILSEFFWNKTLLVLLSIKYADCAEDRLGRLSFEKQYGGKLVRVNVPEKAVNYIHEHADKCSFLPEFVELMCKNTTTIEDITALFRKYSDKVHIEKSSNDEFDYLIYFEDGKPDEYYYCFADEGVRMTYHRFTKEDYKAFGFWYK